MTFRQSLLTLAIAAALAPLAANATNAAMVVPVLETDIIFETQADVVVDSAEIIIAQTDNEPVAAEETRRRDEESKRRRDEARARSDEARKRADEARARGDVARAKSEENRARAEEARARAEESRRQLARARADIRVNVGDINRHVHEAMSSAFAYSFGTGTVKSIKNAPYSGEVINEKIQTLADGNQLTRRTSNKVWRDAAGATRQEIYDADGQLKTIHIRDAEGDRYILTPARKSAIKITSPKKIIHKNLSELDKDGKRIVVANNSNVVIKRIDSDGKEKREEVRVVVNSGDGAGLSAMASLGELGKLGELGELGKLGELGELGNLSGAFAIAGDAFAQAWSHGEPVWIGKDKRYERTSTNLGVKNFDGVVAEGKSTSYTIPAGKVGNAKPIVVSSESWYAPDLQITVYSKHSDPRSGDIIYRVANLKRGEPSGDLFRVPADYAVKDPMRDINAKIRVEKSDKQ